MNALALSQYIPTRTLTNWSSPRGELQTVHLEQVRDTLAKRRAAQDPVDVERSVHSLHVRFGDGGSKRAIGQFLKADGLGEPLVWTQDGMRQFVNDATPAGWKMDTFESLLAADGDKGRKLADLNLALLTKDDQRIRMFRTIRMRDPHTGQVVRAIRADVSQGYATFDNLEFIESMLASKDMRNLPVLSHHETDRYLRLRFALKPVDRLELNKPIPMVEAWNSEVAQRSYGFSWGMWKLVCTNGMTHYSRNAEYRWRHVGDNTKFAARIDNALEEMKTQTSGVLHQYDQALDIAIDNAYAWIEQTLGDRLTDEQVKRSQEALNDETTTPGGLLASVVDAVTLAAQAEIDLHNQAEMERVGHWAMQAGIARASDDGYLKTKAL
jgi:hypothetical protein